MINISISSDGEIVIAQETPGERIFMGEHYAQMERQEAAVSQETLNDEDRAHWFKEGWSSSMREAQLAYVSGRIEEFFNLGERVVSEDPHRNEPERPGEETDTWPPREIDEPDEALEQPLFRLAADSGEPEKECDETAFRGLDGVWTISDDELQARLDAEFERGLAYESPTTPKRYSDAELAMIRADAYGRGMADMGNSSSDPKQILLSALRALTDLVSSQPDEKAEAIMDDLLDMVAEHLGYEVAR